MFALKVTDSHTPTKEAFASNKIQLQSLIRLPAPKSPAREHKKLPESDQRYSERSGESPSPPDGSYGGYHLSYEVKKLM